MYTHTRTYIHTFSFPGDPVVKLLPTYHCSEALCLLLLAQFSAVISSEFTYLRCSCSLEVPMDCDLSCSQCAKPSQSSDRKVLSSPLGTGYKGNIALFFNCLQSFCECSTFSFDSQYSLFFL